MRPQPTSRWIPLALILAAACGDATGPGSKVALNRLKWIARGPASYTYEFRRVCFCIPDALGPVKITVTDRVVQTVVTVTGDPVPPADVDRYFRITIDSLFEILAHAARQSADYMTVSYDAQLGYPTEAFIDFDVSTADEELGFQATLLVR